MDRENQVISYNHELLVDGFKKDSSLFCFNKGKRYLVTAIRPDNGEDNFREVASKILSYDIDNPEKLNKLGRGIDAKYIHLKEYKDGKIVNDLEGAT